MEGGLSWLPFSSEVEPGRCKWTCCSGLGESSPHHYTREFALCELAEYVFRTFAAEIPDWTFGLGSL